MSFGSKSILNCSDGNFDTDIPVAFEVKTNTDYFYPKIGLSDPCRGSIWHSRSFWTRNIAKAESWTTVNLQYLPANSTLKGYSTEAWNPPNKKLGFSRTNRTSLYVGSIPQPEKTATKGGRNWVDSSESPCCQGGGEVKCLATDRREMADRPQTYSPLLQSTEV